MNENDQILALAGIFAQLSGGLLAVVVTLVAVVPTFVEIARARSPNFLSERASRRRLDWSLKLLRNLILVFGLGLLLSIGIFFWVNYFLLILTVVLTCVGILILLVASYVIASTISFVS